ncbi:hypothetical protein NDU88_006078, partial [Pleurodeles waltl]
ELAQQFPRGVIAADVRNPDEEIRTSNQDWAMKKGGVCERKKNVTRRLEEDWGIASEADRSESVREKTKMPDPEERWNQHPDGGQKN